MCEFKRFPAALQSERKRERESDGGRGGGGEGNLGQIVEHADPLFANTLIYAFSRSRWTELHACSSRVGTVKWNTVNVRLRDVSSMSP